MMAFPRPLAQRIDLLPPLRKVDSGKRSFVRRADGRPDAMLLPPVWKDHPAKILPAELRSSPIARVRYYRGRVDACGATSVTLWLAEIPSGRRIEVVLPVAADDPLRTGHEVELWTYQLLESTPEGGRTWHPRRLGPTRLLATP